MITPDGEHVVCDYPGCKEQHKNHAWGRIKAEGWLQLKNGQSYCAAHHPEWVAQWRKNKERKRNGNNGHVG